MTVLGLDACRAGWIGASLSAGGLRLHFAATIHHLVLDTEAEVIGIDIPIGLPDHGRRAADLEARRLIGRRWPSVFLAPVRPALESADYAAAAAENERLTGKKISRQDYGLREKILEVDRWLPTAGRPVVEVHPEVSFARMAGAPLPHPKTTWAGVEHRRELLAAQGIVLSGPLGEAGRRARVDDILDACAVAWTARRVAAGEATRVPAGPERFSDGIDAAIWT